MEDSQLIGNTINFIPKKKEKPKKVNEKFKATEILFVLSAVGVVVFLALLAINPSKEAAEARNLKRSADISTILTYVSAYTRTNRDIPEEIPISDKCVYFTHEICKTGPYNCIDLVDMSFLTEESSDQLVIMPTDPLYISANGTGYFISQDGKGNVVVCAPHAERNEKISFSKYMY